MRQCARTALRIVTTSAPASHALHELARESLRAETGALAQERDARIQDQLAGLLRHGDGAALADVFTSAPSSDVHRHLWRILARSERHGTAAASPVRFFALPVVVVAALDSAAAGPRELPGALPDVAGLAALLAEHGALAGNRTLALAPALVDARALDFDRLPALLATGALEGRGGASPRPDLAPAPIVVAGSTESVHLRFVVGTALAAPAADLFQEAGVGRWGMPFAQKLSTMLAAPGTSVLALARPPLPLVEALWQGRLAQREVAAQLFVSNALREMRARVGEPTAVISVHRGPGEEGAAAAPAEVRLSISSPLEPRDAQGLRSPLWPLDRPGDVVAMLATLLADCRVTNVQVKAGVHPDRDPVTGGPLLFKAGDDAPGVVRH